MVEGTLEDVDSLTAAVTGADALIVSVTGPIKDNTFAQRTLPGIVKAAQNGGVDRLVYVSAFGAGDTAEKASGFARLIYRSLLKGFFADKAKAEQILPSSGLKWTTVYPVNLKEATALPAMTVKPLSDIKKVPGLPTLPFTNLAKALVDIAASETPAGHRLVVTTPKGWKPARRDVVPGRDDSIAI